jgi:hypothetical protein
MIMKIVEVGVVIYVPEYRGIKNSTIPIFREKPTVLSWAGGGSEVEPPF